MRRLFALVMWVLLASSMGLASIAHANEGSAGLELSVAAAMTSGHHAGDADEVPADADMGYPHHHGTCHGEHIGIPVAFHAAIQPAGRRSAGPRSQEAAHPGLETDPGLRPPQA